MFAVEIEKLPTLEGAGGGSCPVGPEGPPEGTSGGPSRWTKGMRPERGISDDPTAIRVVQGSFQPPLVDPQADVLLSGIMESLPAFL